MCLGTKQNRQSISIKRMQQRISMHCWRHSPTPLLSPVSVMRRLIETASGTVHVQPPPLLYTNALAAAPGIVNAHVDGTPKDSGSKTIISIDESSSESNSDTPSSDEPPKKKLHAVASHSTPGKGVFVHGGVGWCTVVGGVLWCTVLYGGVWWCMVLCGGVWWCMVVYGYPPLCCTLTLLRQQLVWTAKISSVMRQVCGVWWCMLMCGGVWWCMVMCGGVW